LNTTSNHLSKENESMTTAPATLVQTPVPAFYDPSDSTRVYKVDYSGRETQALEYRKTHGVKKSAADKVKVTFLLIDGQLTFCNPNYELYVMGAEQDNDRICRWIYENISHITKVRATMDTHYRNQIFHPHFWVNDKGEHPGPGTQISNKDIATGVWKVNPEVAPYVSSGNLGFLAKHVEYYTSQLEDTTGGRQRLALTIWPYHAILGGLGHALVPALHEAIWFHECVRAAHTDLEVKGGNPLTENYSVFRPEVLDTYNGQAIAQRNTKLIEETLRSDIIVVGGQAASHCVAWSMYDFLVSIVAQDPSLAKKIYFVRDFTSPVVIPGILDFTNAAEKAFADFAAQGVNIVDSTTPFAEWPGIAEIYKNAN